MFQYHSTPLPESQESSCTIPNHTRNHFTEVIRIRTVDDSTWWKVQETTTQIFMDFLTILVMRDSKVVDSKMEIRMSEEKLEVEMVFLERDSSGRKSVRVKPSKLAISHFYGLWRSNCSFSKYLQIIVAKPPKLRNHLITELCQYVFVGQKTFFANSFLLASLLPKMTCFQ